MNVELLLNYLESLHGDYMNLKQGAVASYIPELAKADSEWFGIALVTVDGRVYQAGDTRQAFTIQSISKAVTYGIALEDYGVESVMRKIDVEPSGEAFNSISLEPGTGRPRNAMINAGAIAAMSFIAGDSFEAKQKRMLDAYKNYLGHEVSIDEAVYRSEKSTGHRNRAIAYLLRNSNIIESDPDGLLDLYFRQCSILVNCRDLAILAATLANGGVNPITGVRALKSRFVPKVLSVMTSCGMYDYSGAWIYEVGMPAKSGVGGGIMAVLPGQLGIAVFSPRLDEYGNSVRGLAVCKRVSSDFGLHMFHAGRTTAASVIHSTYSAAGVASKRTRHTEQSKLLRELGHKIVVLELQGDLMFASAEVVVSEAMKGAQEADYLVLDFRRTASISDGAMNLLGHLVQALDGKGKAILFTGIRDEFHLARAIRKRVPHVRDLPLLKCEDLDDALEWCEDQLLAGQSSFIAQHAPLAVQAFCAGFAAAELSALEALLEPRTYLKGVHIFRAGEPASGLFFILSGQVSVVVPVDHRRNGRISTLSAGTAFGEMGVLDRGVRSADVVADSDMSCLYLDYERLERDGSALGVQLTLKLVTNVARVLTQKLRQATLEIGSLKS